MRRAECVLFRAADNRSLTFAALQIQTTALLRSRLCKFWDIERRRETVRACHGLVFLSLRPNRENESTGQGYRESAAGAGLAGKLHRAVVRLGDPFYNR